MWRYVRAVPDTIAARKAIRERGLALLTQLHESGRYRRIVFAAHSLGAIIAYDLICEFWAQKGPSPENPPGEETLKALEALDAFVGWTDGECGLKPPDVSLPAFRAAQRTVFEAMRSESDTWLISDFVTLGSPLSHADFLLAYDLDELSQAERDRLLSLAPPLPDDPVEYARNPDSPRRGRRPPLCRMRRQMTARPAAKSEKHVASSLLYAPSLIDRAAFATTGMRVAKKWFPHHAAPFAVVRWTNIYDPHRAIFFGDLVSGEHASLFGPGIEDQKVTILRKGIPWPLSRFFTHTLYWDLAGTKVGRKRADHIDLLRKAVALEES